MNKLPPKYFQFYRPDPRISLGHICKEIKLDIFALRFFLGFKVQIFNLSFGRFFSNCMSSSILKVIIDDQVSQKLFYADDFIEGSEADMGDLVKYDFDEI